MQTKVDFTKVVFFERLTKKLRKHNHFHNALKTVREKTPEKMFLVPKNIS